METHLTISKEKIYPFYWVEHNDSVSVCLSDLSYIEDVFILREDEGFEDNFFETESFAMLKKAEE